MAAISLSAASSVMLGLEDAGREAFESQVRARSTRRHDATFAVGYYISPRLLRELNERIQNATLAHLKSETSVQRAYAISQRDEHAFTAYRVFFTNDATGLATEIARRCKDKNPPQMVLKWISAWIGPVPTVVSHEVDSSGRSSSRSYTTETTLPTCELRHLALVAAALTLYGEHVLAALYAHDSSMGGVKDIPLLSEELRHPRKQRECLQRARWRSKRPARVLHAAHYLPLDLTIQWNNALAPALRLSASDLAWILNHPSNLKAVPHRVNTRDHRKVEHFVAAFIRHAHDEHVPARLKTTSWLAWRNTRDRLAHIARRVQSLELQSALLQANGHALYALIRETFERIDRVFAARGLDFGAIWVASDSSSRVSERVRMPALPHSTCDGDVESETACPC